MSRRGTYKYICEDCGSDNWFSSKERNSSFKPKCNNCGSLWLNPSTKSRGTDKIKEAQKAIRESITIRNKKMKKL